MINSFIRQIGTQFKNNLTKNHWLEILLVISNLSFHPYNESPINNSTSIQESFKKN